MKRPTEQILIVSERADITTDKVTKWLLAKDCSFQRKNYEDVSKFSILLDSDKSTVNLGNPSFKTLWNRRARLQFLSDSLLQSEFSTYLQKEESPAICYIEKHLSNKDQFSGTYIEEKFNNKILNLEIARESGLNIPKTLVTNSKVALQEFFKINGKVMAKCIYNDPNIIQGQNRLYTGTNRLINQAQIESLHDLFAPSLFQKYIHKQYEVRIFVYMDQYYPMAILSQSDSKTQLDFRNYNLERPNRNLPYRLPKSILKNLQDFMSRKKMNSGSIDLMVDHQDDYYFLEINPQGQLDWLSSNCNYYIEKNIANLLANE